jgi:hypothetical protein
MSKAPVVEPSEAELAELGRLALNLSRNPETGRPFRKLVKKVEPGRTFPSDEVQDLREELAAKAETDRIETEKKVLLAAQEHERAVLAERYTDEQIKEIEAVMTKHGIPSYSAAAMVYASQLKPSNQRSARDQLTGGRTWSLPDMPGLFENPSKFATDEATKVIDEIRSGVFTGA